MRGVLHQRARHWSRLLLLLVALLLASCGAPASGAGKAAWPGRFTVPAAATPTPPPVSFPRDEAPHDTLTEWWYYTGHLRASDGTRYGFESVIFQSLRGELPPYFAAHVAIIDHQRQRFSYDQRTQQGGAVQPGSAPDRGFNLRLGDWAWRGFDGRDHLESGVAGYRFTLDLTATKPPALHLGGYIDYGAAGGTYYYSRTRMTISGTIDDGGVQKEVTGDAWFDHQWGNFITISVGGWDWFSVQLADGSDFTIYLIRAAGARVVGSFGTYVAPDGAASTIAAGQIVIDVIGSWTSPATGVTYPSGWRVSLPGQGLVLTCTPVLPDQELDVRRSTGNIYWEGEVRVAGTRGGAPLDGAGYVELTGYDQR